MESEFPSLPPSIKEFQLNREFEAVWRHHKAASSDIVRSLSVLEVPSLNSPNIDIKEEDSYETPYQLVVRVCEHVYLCIHEYIYLFIYVHVIYEHVNEGTYVNFLCMHACVFGSVRFAESRPESAFHAVV